MQWTKKFTGQMCFIDSRKAFDSLDHSQLLHKLYNYAIRGPIFHLMSDYLTNTWQYVFDNELSKNFLLLLVYLKNPSWGLSFF